MSEQDPTAEAVDQSDMPKAKVENNPTVCETNSDNLTTCNDLSAPSLTPTCDDVSELSNTKNCDELKESDTKNLDELNESKTKILDELKENDTKNLDELKESDTKNLDELKINDTKNPDELKENDTKNLEGVTEPSGTENHDGLKESSTANKSDGSTEPADGPGDEEGEISSPKEEPDEKPFAVECELDFEDEGGDHSEKVSKKAKDKKDGEGDDDGECSDGEVDEEEDLEEGELKEEPTLLENNTTSKLNPPTKTVCRFYNRGQCFYGNNCRFLHVTTGNYSMFAPARPTFSDAYEPTPLGNMTHAMMNHRPPPRSDFSPVPPLLGSQTASQPAAVETAWERGLREAKELVKKANKRKVEEPDFEEKRLNLSLVVNEKNIPEQLENEPPPYKKKKRDNPPFPKREYDDPHDMYDDGYDARPHSQHWREGQYDNMEVRYHKEQRRDRGRTGRMDRERDKFNKSPERKFRDDRLQQVQNRSRVDDYFDPWRRSKSPKGNLRRTRSRSGSYSSVSSYSYSSRSSCSYSRSSSRSSSRSPHLHDKRTPSPTNAANPPFGSPKLGPNKFTTMKKKPVGRPHSISRSRSRSFSRSISMDSVSSASSSISHSSRSPNSRGSILRKQDNSTGDQKPDSATTATAPNPSSIPLPSVYLNYNAPNKECKVEKVKDTPKEPPPIMDEDERDPLEESFLTPLEVPFPSLQHLLPSNDKAKETFKSAPHKQQIKLTLLNKNPKLNNLPKKELDVNRKQIDEPTKPGFYSAVKSPLSPPLPPVSTKPAPVLVPKKSASSRRDELLKQLKAVEDAIARKRAKFG